MKREAAQKERERAALLARRLDLSRSVAMRLAAILLFALSVAQWIGLVGVEAGALRRFDLMPVAWRMASATLAVLYPVAGIGLWMLAPWGSVVWALVAATLAIMHLGFPEIFGANPVALLPHLVGLAALLALRIARARAERRANDTHH